MFFFIQTCKKTCFSKRGSRDFFCQFWDPILGPGISAKSPGGAFWSIIRPRATFFLSISEEKARLYRKREKRYFSEEKLCFLRSQGRPKWSPGAPWGSQNDARKGTKSKRRKRNILVSLCRFCVVPDALIFTCSLILGGLFAISRGKQRTRAPPPEPRKRVRTHAKSCPGPLWTPARIARDPFGHFGSILVDWGSIWGSILEPFWINVGCILG